MPPNYPHPTLPQPGRETSYLVAAERALDPGLVDDAVAGPRYRLQARLVDRLATCFTDAVGALVETAQRIVDILQLAFDDGQRRETELAVERLGAELGRMLIDLRELA